MQQHYDSLETRKPADRELAIARMRQCGAQIVSREMVAFEWLRHPGHPRFRDVLTIVK